jgi:hypothetical protein
LPGGIGREPRGLVMLRRTAAALEEKAHAAGPVGDAAARVTPRRIAGIVRSVVRTFPSFWPDDFAGIRP